MLANSLLRAVGGIGWAQIENPGTAGTFYDGNAEVGMLVYKTAGTYSLTPLKAGNVEVLVVAGGGGRKNTGSGGSAGGGAGGVLYDDEYAVTTVAITITVGAGKQLANGDNSVFSTLTAVGGGMAGALSDIDGANGGSGGGGYVISVIPGTGTAGPPRQGYNGGIGNDGFGSTYNSGGGGGAGAAGGSTTTAGVGGAGGAGLQYFGQFYGGGGGGFAYTTGGAGGSSIGGKGGTNASSVGGNGLANTGSGGGGGITHGTGGSGIVIVRWGGYSKNYNPTTDAVS